jgi:hypothetical protein
MRKSQVDRLGFFVSTVLIELAQNQRWRSKNQDTQWIGFFFDNDVAGLSEGNSRLEYLKTSF